jgi:hypothetical protein
MKRLKLNKYVLFGLGLLITGALFLLGQHGHSDTAGTAIASGAVISLTEAEKDGFNEQEQKVILAVKKMASQMKEGIATGLVSKEEIASLVSGIKLDKDAGDAAKTLKEQLEDLKEIARKQGTTLTELNLKMNDVETGGKSIAEAMDDAKDELKRVYNQGSGNKQFMVVVNHKGQFVARPYDPTAKAAGPHASIADVGTAGNTASIASSINAATILRMAGDAPIQSQYRNSPWVFDLCNLVNVGMDMPFAVWYDEQAKQGASATVAEGGSKPLSQYAYSLKSAEYKKEATLLGFTQEFSLDFERLQSDILGKGRIDVINRINTAVLANIITAGTAYNTQASFGTRAAANVNDWLALAAMAAQVDSATFGANANAAIMSTYKKYNLGTLQTTQMEWLDVPSVLSNLSLIGNPAMAADNVLVGDFKQYNILLRGGLIVKVGYNGTDFAENRFSTVMEQYYFDYISTLRTPAIVKGTTFATVKTAITTP